jgi:hypothetical protein
MVQTKHILVVDALLILGSLIGLVLLVGYARPLVIAPLDGAVSENASVLFVLARGDTVLIDDNLEFTSPDEIHVDDSLVVTLESGVYYWKVRGAFESDVRRLTILSHVDLRLRRENDGSVAVVNSGTERLAVSTYEQGILSGQHTVDVGESSTITDGITKVIGGKQ